MNGCDTLVAHTGEEAISQKRTESFDVTLMDVAMPGLDGMETYLRYRDIDPGANVYMMTGYSADERREQVLAAGVRDVLHKPLDIARLLDVVGRGRGSG